MTVVDLAGRAMAEAETFDAAFRRRAAADVLVCLWAARLLPADPRTVAVAAAAVGIDVDDLRAARERHERGWNDQARRAAQLVQLRPTVVSLTAAPPPSPGPAVPARPVANPRMRRGSQTGLPADRRRCPRCKETLPIDRFDRRGPADPRPRSYCRACFPEYQRERYLSVEKVKVLNAAKLTFRVGDADRVVGMACTDCGCPIRPGELVCGEAALRHAERCPTARRELER